MFLPHPIRRLCRASAYLGVAVLALSAAACDGGSNSPTDPGPPPPAAGAATVEGEVSVVGGNAGGLTAGPTAGVALDPGSPAGSRGGPTATASPATSGAGVVVRVQGTDLSTTAGADGRFLLQGVPGGDRVLVFETPQSAAPLPIQDIQPSETIRLSVTVSGSNATVTDMDRDGGEDAEGELDLRLQLSPDTWNLNYENSSGTVTAFIRGQGFRDVILESIVLVGDAMDAEPLEPVSASRQGNHVRARFAKSEVLGILDGPEDGSVHTVALRFEVDGVDGLQELTAEVRIVGPDEDDEEDEEEDGEDEELGNLSLQLSPATWNTNWDKANGHVTAFIRGTGLAAIDTDSIELEGDDPEAEPLPASSARLEGNHVRAQFPQNQVLGLLDDPQPGQTHMVVVRFTADEGAETFELEADVRIVGPPV